MVVEKVVNEYIGITIEQKVLNTTITTIVHMKCQFCNYVWAPRTKSPKRCPRCSNLLARVPVQPGRGQFRLFKTEVFDVQPI